MSTAKTTHEVKPGDVIVVEPKHVGDGRRMGEVLEVIGEKGHEHYRIRWEDGRETLLYASSDAVVHRPR